LALKILQETITRLLYSIGTKREVERHLRIFSSSSDSSQPAKFAVIKIGGAVLDQLDELALSVSFLYRVGLYPVILHGGGPQLNEIIEREGIIPEYIDGIRVTGAFRYCSITIHSHLPRRRKNLTHCSPRLPRGKPEARWRPREAWNACSAYHLWRFHRRLPG